MQFLRYRIAAMSVSLYQSATEAFDMLTVVELIQTLRNNKLWNACAQALCRCANSAMMHKDTGPGQQKVQWHITFVPNRGRKWRQLVAEPAKKDTAGPKQLRSFQSRFEEDSGIPCLRSCREDHRRKTSVEKLT
jgi:hypothetical protein